MNGISPGQKPLAEFSSTNKCNGVVGMWNMGIQNNNYEVYGVLTTNGSLLITQISPSSTGGQFDGLYNWEDGNGNTKTYYWYPAGNDPMPQYPGTTKIGGRYFIPISSTIHTHTPCVLDGSDGITGRSGDDDFPMASKFPSIKHYVIGCDGKTAEFNSNSYFNIKNGPLTTSCNGIN